MKAEPNDNLVSCEAPTAPVDNDDSTPFDDFVKWYLQKDWSAHVRRPIDMDVLDKMQQMRDHCDKLERENEQSKMYIRDVED